MTISTTTTRQGFAGNGSTTVFAFAVPIKDPAHLLVQLVVADVLGAPLVLGVDYTLSGWQAGAGGTLTMSVAPASGATLLLRRVMPLTQVMSIRNQGPFYPAMHEDKFDELTMLAQQLDEEGKRGVRLPPQLTPGDFDPTLPAGLVGAGAAGKTLVVNLAGDGFEAGETGGGTIPLDGSVTVTKLGAEAVETAKIKDLNVTTAKLADGSVTVTKLGAEAVETAKIKDGAVTASKLAPGLIGVPPHEEVYVYTGNGHGSTNTCIRRFLTVGAQVGSAISYADSAANGASFTINETGLYAISYGDTLSSTFDIGVSVNSNQLTTGISAITAAHRRLYEFTNDGTSVVVVVAGTVLFLTAGDVVRPHTSGAAADTTVGRAQFRIIKLR
jgi:hypothetical protein